MTKGVHEMPLWLKITAEAKSEKQRHAETAILATSLLRTLTSRQSDNYT